MNSNPQGFTWRRLEFFRHAADFYVAVIAANALCLCVRKQQTADAWEAWVEIAPDRRFAAQVMVERDQALEGAVLNAIYFLGPCLESLDLLREDRFRVVK